MLEILFADQSDLWVFDAMSGGIKLQEPQLAAITCNEYPVVADVDGDDQAEIVFVSNAYSDTFHGLSVVGDLNGSWRPTRSLWNQHAYEITNVNGDGTIPTSPPANWLTHNTFRAQDTTPQYPPEVDAVPLVTDICTVECEQGRLRIVVQVGSTGVAELPAGISSSLYAISGAGYTLIETFQTEDPIPSAGTSPGHVFELTPDQVPYGAIAFVVDDPGDGSGEVDECDEDDNVIEETGIECEEAPDP